ncbi:MAG: thioredoxin domain-containing protein, partial [Pyrinomonadaceae bacterium]
EQLYAIRKVVLDNYITKIILEDEANLRKISVEDLRKLMTSGNVEIANEKVEKEYLANAPYFALMSSDEAKERIRLDLENEAKIQLYRKALLSFKKKAKIEIILKPPALLTDYTNEKQNPTKGSESAKLVIVEYADFRCHYCKESQEVLKKILADFKVDIKLIYRHLPLQTDLKSLTPAISAYCAGEQDRFWELHDKLFSIDDLSLGSIKRMADEIKLDNSKFGTCLTSEKSRFAVLSDLKEATQLGITSTPTFVINGKIFPGKRSSSEFNKIVESELEVIRKKKSN